MKVLATECLWMGLLAALLIPAASRSQGLKNDFILYGGDVVTMDEKNPTAEAVWVRDGRIEAVGKREEVMRLATKTTELIDLHDGALLPGFVEPHFHLDAVTLLSFHEAVNPCLPEPYETHPATCPVGLLGSLKKLGRRAPEGSGWLVGSGIDPSREWNLDLARSFHEQPARFIDEYVSKTRPVIILDASGHLAYVNLRAFVEAGICKSVDNCTAGTTLKTKPKLPGEWATNPDGGFTGLLVEAPAYTDFMAVIPQPKWFDFARRAEERSRDYARTGVTTMVNGGTFSGPVPDLFQTLAFKESDHPFLRYRVLLPVQPDGPQDFGTPSPWDESNGALYGVAGLKIVSDGSDQGCTGALVDPYSQKGLCSEAGRGRPDYTKRQIHDMLASPWKAGWPVQIHTNGDQAILNALDVFAALQTESRDKPNASPMVLLHFTIDGNPQTREDMVQRVADLRAGRYVHDGRPAPPVDVRVSHLIGHVAYWGGAFQSILDGVEEPGTPDEMGRAARIDATKRDLELRVPFSLHSDDPVTPVHPLWYVEQAVTRRTWFYPKLKETDAYPMPGGQNITVEQALRAITIEAAAQSRLDSHIGSIEKGKVADLVILARNPLEQPPNEIHKIRVLSTFVGGYRNDWSKER